MMWSYVSVLNIMHSIVFEDPLAFIRYLQLDLVSKCIMAIYYDWIARQLKLYWAVQVM